MNVKSILPSFGLISKNSVKVFKDDMPKATYERLSKASGVLENYARHKGVNIDILSVGTIDKGNNADRVLAIVVKDPKSKKLKVSEVSSDVGAIIKRTEEKSIMFDDAVDDLQYARKLKSTYEDNFLRNVYQKVEEMVHSLEKKRK